MNNDVTPRFPAQCRQGLRLAACTSVTLKLCNSETL